MSADDDHATQTRRPWHATARTMAAALIAAIPLLPIIAETAGIDDIPAVAGVLGISGAVTRVLADKRVEQWLRRHAPFLAADPPPRAKRDRPTED